MSGILDSIFNWFSSPPTNFPGANRPAVLSDAEKEYIKNLGLIPSVFSFNKKIHAGIITAINNSVDKDAAIRYHLIKLNIVAGLDPLQKIRPEPTIIIGDDEIIGDELEANNIAILKSMGVKRIYTKITYRLIDDFRSYAGRLRIQSVVPVNLDRTVWVSRQNIMGFSSGSPQDTIRDLQKLLINLNLKTEVMRLRLNAP